MSSLIDRVRDHKSRARGARDFEEWPEAVAEYNEAIKLLEPREVQLRARLRAEVERDGASSAVVSQLEKDLVSELADCYGSRGGVQRRWGEAHYKESLESYDLGYLVEVYPPYGSIDTYNTVNRIVARVLVDPRWAHGGPPREWEDGDSLESMLDNARERLRERLRRLKAEGKTDPWAEADAIMLQALQREASLDLVEDAMLRFDEMSPPRSAYGSGYDTVKLLAALDIPQQAKLKVIRDHFERRAGVA